MNSIKKYTFFVFLFVVSYDFSQVPAYAPTTNLLAWYSFSGNVLDNSGNGHNNANYNISLTTDRFNTIMRALYFSGNGAEFLNYGDVDDFEGQIQLSLSFWILPEDHGQSTPQQVRPIISKWASATDLQGSSYNLFLDGSNLNFVLTDGSASDTVTVSSSTIPLNQWSHVVITFNYGFTKIYVNNNLLADTNISISQIKASTRDFKVGDWYNSDNNSYVTFLGKIDDIGIWNRALDACEVDALYTGNNCLNAAIAEISSSHRQPVKIFDITGRESDDLPNTVLIYQYSDGTTEKVFRME